MRRGAEREGRGKEGEGEGWDKHELWADGEGRGGDTDGLMAVTLT